MDWLGHSLWAFEVAGRQSGTAKVDRLLEVFGYARARYGIRLFVIDNLTKCGIDEDDYNGQKAAIVAITEFANEHDVHIIVVAHQRKSEDEFARGGKMGIRGSSAIGDLSDNIWIIWRNRKKEFELKQLAAVDVASLSPEERAKHNAELEKWQSKGDSYFTCEKYRDGDDEPYICLFFDHGSHQFLMDKSDTPRRYA
jgi:twinkle protein